MNSIVNLKDGFITFNSNIDNSLSFSKCAIGYSNYSLNSHERGSLVFLTNNNANTANVSMHSDIRMCIASDGNVGIGTTTNTTGVLLDVNGVIESRTNIGANNAFYFRGVANSDINRVITAGTFSTNSAVNDTIIRSTNKLVLQSGIAAPGIVIDTANNVGIGITNPNINNNLNIHKNAEAQNIRIAITDGTTTGNADRGLHLIKGPTNIGYLYNYENNSLVFGTNGTERMRILANGNIGIGTAIPETTLDVNGNLLIRAYGTSGSGTRGIFFRPDFVTTNQYNCSILTFDHGGGGTTDGLSINGFDGLSFCTGAGTRQERMRIAENGNVGIGTDNIAYKLHVKCVYDSIPSGLHLDASDSSPPNQYALTIYPYVVGSGQVGWKFRSQSQIGGAKTPLTFDNAGNVILGGTISGDGSLLTTINAANISSGTINSLRLPTATNSVLGGVKVDGTTITINSSTGVISGANTYVLPTATNSVLGGVKKGNNINIAGDGTISVDLVSYTGNSTINGDLVVNSNLIVHGTSTTLNTDVYTTERLDITNSGTTNSTLTIKQTAAGNTNSIFNVIGSSSTTVFNVSSTGNVGIGTTNPSSKLHITTTSSTNLLDFRNSDNFGIYATSLGIGNRGNTLDFLARDYNSGGAIQTINVLSLRPEGNVNISEVLTIGSITAGVFNYVPKLVVYGAAAGTNASAIFKHPNDSQGIGIRYDGIFQTNTNANLFLTTTGTGVIVFNTNGADRMKIESSGTISTYNNNINVGTGTITATTFSGNATTAGNLTGTPNINVGTITTSGNVGIGTTNPVGRLHLHNTTANSDVSIRFSDGTSGATTNDGFSIGEDSNQRAYLWNNEDTDMAFATNKIERLTIKNDGNVGIGTNSNIQSKLTINPIVIDRNNFNHSEAPLTITNPTPTSSSVLNDPKSVLHLCRQGTDSQSFGAKASFKLCRYENSTTNSRSRLDITLANNLYDDINAMTILGNGDVGIGTTNPIERLHLHNTSLSGVGIRFSNSYSGATINDGFSIGEDSNLKVYLTNNEDTDMTFATNKIERVTIKNDGSVGIGTNNPFSIFHLHKNALAQDVRIILSDNTSTASGSRGFHLAKVNNNAYVWNVEDTALILGTNGTERIRILNTGNVGINTIDPQALLDIVKSTAVTTNVDLLNMRFDANWGLRVQQSYIAAGDIRYNLIHKYNNVDYNSLTFKGANVGIGTINPAQRLHIVHTNNNLIRIETDTNAISQTSGIEFGVPAFATATRSKITSTTSSGDASDLQFYTANATNGSTLRLSIASTGTISTYNNNINVGTGTVTAAIFSGALSGNATTSTTATTATNLSNAANITTGTINSDRLPVASVSVLGGVKVDGTTITINSSTGVISGANTYVLPTATTSVLGGVKVDGTIHTIITDTLKIIEPTSKQIVEESVIREYPPIRNFQAPNTTGYSGKPFTVSNQLYGNGTYTIYYTSKTSSSYYTANNLWWDNGDEARWADANYNASTGLYNKTLSIVSDSSYLGDGVSINFPVSIKITSYTLKHYTSNQFGAAKDIRIYGSKDSINWDILDTKTNITYTSGFYTGTITTTEYYNHYALSVNRLAGGVNSLVMSEWHIYGKENLGGYYYKNNSVIKYVAGNQSDINLRNTGSWQIVDDFSIPIATTSVLGGVKKGNNINIDGNGTISVDLATYNDNSIINGNLVVNSNLIVHGVSTTLNTDVYINEILDITNSGTINSTLTIKQTAAGNTNNILNVINSATLNVFNVSSTGNTGIGTTNPINRLHLHNTTANSDVSIRFSDFTSGASATQGFAIGKNTAQQAYLWNYVNTDMLFATNNAERLRILANGNVGIGTATGIGEKLVVSGNAQITGTISGDGSLLTSINAANISSGTINSLRLPIADTGTIGGLKIDGTIHTTNNATLGLVEPTSKQTLGIETVERMYPPIRNFTGASGTTTTLSGQSYGNGNYTIHYTSQSVGNAEPSEVFNTQTTYWKMWGSGNYTYVSNAIGGTYNKNLSIVGDTSYLGDGIRIQFPVSIKITSYILTHTSGLVGSAPNDFKIYGSRNGTKWFVLDAKTSTSYASNSYTGTITTTEYYSHFALSVNKTKAAHVSHNALVLEAWYIYGKETTGYYYKDNSIIKYIKGDQTNTNTRDTGSWQIVDDFSIPIATTSVLGGVKKGNNINIDGNGTISVDLATYNDNSIINGNLVVNSNLIVHGASTTLNTEVYTTEILDITNSGTINSTLTIKQTAAGNTNSIFNVIGSSSTNVFNVSSTGNVGIGTTNPINRLHLHNTTANSDVAIRFTDSTTGAGATNGFVIGENSTQKAYLWNYGNTDMLFATNGVERMTISNAGNVGIGTISALSSLHLHKNALTQDVRMIISDNTSTSSLTRGLHLIKGTDNIGYLWNYENTPLILAANNAERMRIAENGNVGIGVSPSYKLHVKCVNGSEASGLHLDSSDTGVNQYALTIWPYVIAGSTVGWKFRTQSTIGGIQTPLTFDNAGNVILGGTISGNGSLLTSINATNISSGTIDSLRLPTATSSVLGGVKVDGTTITINSSTGVITSVGGGGSAQWTTSGINIYNANTGNVGIGTNDPATYKCQINGNLGATGNITAYYSDERLKNITEYVSDVLPVLDKINVFKYNCNDLAESFGYDKSKKEIGLSAQEIQKYYPEIVSIAPFDADLDKETNQIISKSGENYLTLDYERLVPVLLQAIKELNRKYTALEDKYNKIMPT
jgi:phage FluMu protein gp41